MTVVIEVFTICHIGKSLEEIQKGFNIDLARKPAARGRWVCSMSRQSKDESW